MPLNEEGKCTYTNGNSCLGKVCRLINPKPYEPLLWGAIHSDVPKVLMMDLDMLVRGNLDELFLLRPGLRQSYWCPFFPKRTTTVYRAFGGTLKYKERIAIEPRSSEAKP